MITISILILVVVVPGIIVSRITGPETGYKNENFE